tara:strand:- start:19907 stop:20845 length:939 start_codon:yes stop_codon:yes gene_type:complete
MTNPTKEILDNGLYIFKELLDKNSIESIFKKIINKREFSSSLFQTEEEYQLERSHLKHNPTKTFNFLNQFDEDLKFIQQNDEINKLITELLGDDYEIVIRKAVCGVPSSWLPKWVKAKIKGVNVPNLGPYIKDKFRDITYFRGIDFHQDIIDWPKGKTDLDPSTFMTLYVYIHEVGKRDSPLHLLENSHKLGATLFPHKLKKIKNNIWLYENGKGDKVECKERVLTGKPGYAAIWHNCTLHGTQPVENESDKFRISLRYLIGKSKKNFHQTYIDQINSNINGELEPIKTRQDLDELGKPILKEKVNLKNEKN